MSISTPIRFTLHLQTNILIDRGRVTWINLRLEKTASMCVTERACMRQRFLWCESVNHVLCSECKVQNSPVCNKTELQSRNGIPLHSMDSASPGGWINVCPCAHSHKQSLSSLSKPMNPPVSDQSYLKQSCQTDTCPMNTQDARDFFKSQWQKPVTVAANSHNVKQGIQSMTRKSSISEDHTGSLPHGIQRNILYIYRKTGCWYSVYMTNAYFFLSVSFHNSISLPPTAFSLFHHSVQLFFLPLPNRPADAEPGPHSKTAGVRESQLINTQNYLPPPNHISFFSNMHKEKQREKGSFP